jgi:hypothetical protein
MGAAYTSDLLDPFDLYILQRVWSVETEADKDDMGFRI